MKFSTFSLQYKHHHCPSPNFFIFPSEALYLLNTTFLLLPLQSLEITILFSVSMNLTTLVTLNKYNHSICVLENFTHHNVLKVHLFCNICQNFYPFSGLNNIPLYAYTTFCLFIHLSIDTEVTSTF